MVNELTRGQLYRYTGIEQRLYKKLTLSIDDSMVPSNSIFLFLRDGQPPMNRYWRLVIFQEEVGWLYVPPWHWVSLGNREEDD